jgi:carbon starvation protein
MGVFVASFAATTLDTACRLQRYVVQEIAVTLAPRHRVNGKRTGEFVNGNPLFWLTNRHAATLFAITIAFFIAQLPGGEGKAPGTGGLLLWPLFGAINQLLAGLAFLVITFLVKTPGSPLLLSSHSRNFDAYSSCDCDVFKSERLRRIIIAGYYLDSVSLPLSLKSG